MAKRQTVTIRLTEEAKKELDGLNARLEIPRTKITERLLEWFTKEPELLQLRILGAFSEATSEQVRRMYLDADSERGSPPGDTGSPPTKRAKSA